MEFEEIFDLEIKSRDALYDIAVEAVRNVGISFVTQAVADVIQRSEYYAMSGNFIDVFDAQNKMVEMIDEIIMSYEDSLNAFGDDRNIGEYIMQGMSRARNVIKITGDDVLDPFNGSGTTVLVAQRLGRVGIGVDCSFEYCDEAMQRTGIRDILNW